MIGVDTNVLARLFVDDDAKQSAAARRFFLERTIDDPAFVSAVVVAEFVWLLTSRYRYPQETIHAALAALFSSANVVVEREDLLKSAVTIAGDRNADITDAIIAAVANDNACLSVVTFDREAAKRIPGMERLK